MDRLYAKGNYIVFFNDLDDRGTTFTPKLQANFQKSDDQLYYTLQMFAGKANRIFIADITALGKDETGVAKYADEDEFLTFLTENSAICCDTNVIVNGKHSELILDDGTNPHGTTQSDVGLSNVDNTSDANKPVSIATQTALDLKADEADLQNHVNDTSNPHSTNASDVGLDQVDNTSDLDKPISNATQSALNLKLETGDNVSALVNDANYLQTVATDATITGDGTVGNPLSSVGGGVGTAEIAMSQGNWIQNIITVPTLTSNQNNWNPVGFNSNTDLIRVNVNSNNRSISGIIAPPLGVNRILAIKNTNTASSDLRFENNNSGSLAQNRFLCRDNNRKSIKPNEMAIWFYDHIAQRWTPFNRIG